MSKSNDLILLKVGGSYDKKCFVTLSFFYPLFIIVCFINACAEKKDFILVNHGKSSYKIVLSKEASMSEKHAAKELQHFIHMATNATIPIVNENEIAAREPQRIFVGASEVF